MRGMRRLLKQHNPSRTDAKVRGPRKPDPRAQLPDGRSIILHHQADQRSRRTVHCGVRADRLRRFHAS